MDTGDRANWQHHEHGRWEPAHVRASNAVERRDDYRSTVGGKMCSDEFEPVFDLCRRGRARVDEDPIGAHQRPRDESTSVETGCAERTLHTKQTQPRPPDPHRCCIPIASDGEHTV